MASVANKPNMISVIMLSVVILNVVAPESDPTMGAAERAPLQFSSHLVLCHRDKTRVQMPAKMFPHLKLICWLFMGPTLGVGTKQRNSF